MALTDFQKQITLRLNQGESPESIARVLAVDLSAVLEAKEIAERYIREHSPPMPVNWPTGPYTDEELRSIAESLETDIETVRATFPGAATQPDAAPDS